MNTKNSITIWAISSLVVLVALYAIYLMVKPEPIEIQGEVVATEIKVSSKIPGRIDSLLVHKGDYIKAGELLYAISSPEIDAKLQQAQAAREAALAQESKANSGARSEDIQAAYNNWQKAKAAAELASKTYQRVENLYAEGVVPEQKKDEAETQMKAASETEKAAHAIYEKASNGARGEDKQAARALVKKADGAIAEVESYIGETRIKAPISGEVANIIADKGELIPTGYPVITIVDLTDVWVNFSLREDYLSDIKKGSRFMAKVPALGMKQIELEVSYIHAMGDFATWTATKAQGDFDMKTFEVHARPVLPVDGLRPGMSILVNWKDIQSNHQTNV